MQNSKDNPTNDIITGNQFELTIREFEVLQYASQGYTNKEIGELTYITVNTVKKHMRSIILKLGVKNRTEAVYKALKTHIL